VKRIRLDIAQVPNAKAGTRNKKEKHLFSVYDAIFHLNISVICLPSKIYYLLVCSRRNNVMLSFFPHFINY